MVKGKRRTVDLSVGRVELESVGRVEYSMSAAFDFGD